MSDYPNLDLLRAGLRLATAAMQAENVPYTAEKQTLMDHYEEQARVLLGPVCSPSTVGRLAAELEIAVEMVFYERQGLWVECGQGPFTETIASITAEIDEAVTRREREAS